MVKILKVRINNATLTKSDLNQKHLSKDDAGCTACLWLGISLQNSLPFFILILR